MLISKDRGDCNFISLRFGKKLSLMAKNLSHLSRSRPLDIVERVLFISAYILRVQIDIHCVPRFYTPISYCVYFIIILPYALLSHLIPWSATYTRALPVTSLKHCLPLHHTLLPLPQYIAVLLIFSIPDDAVDQQRVRDFFLFRFLI